MPVQRQGARVTFLAGVLDWHSSELPTVDVIAGAACIAQGVAHLKVITESGGSVLGFRELALDEIEPWLFRAAHGWQNSEVLRGFVAVRPQTPDDNELPVLSTWGLRVACDIADNRFVKA